MSAHRHVDIRPLVSEEAGAFRVVAQRCFGLLDSVGFSAAGDGVVAAIDDDGQVVGGTVRRTFSSAGRTISVVDDVFADPERAPSGTGGALRDDGLAWFEEVGTNEVVANIEPLNTASESLHRAGGFAPLPWRAQAARWGWQLPVVQLRAHLAPYGTNERPWARPVQPDDRWWRLLHVPWSTGVPVSSMAALVFGLWVPLTGSSTPAPGGTWRLDRETRWMLPAHLVGGLTIAALAWALVLIDPSGGAVPWSDVARAATMLAAFDLVVPARHFVGTTARLAWDHSRATWGLVATIGSGPTVLALVG